METAKVMDYARSLLDAHGDKAEAEAAQKAAAHEARARRTRPRPGARSRRRSARCARRIRGERPSQKVARLLRLRGEVAGVLGRVPYL